MWFILTLSPWCLREKVTFHTCREWGRERESSYSRWLPPVQMLVVDIPHPCFLSFLTDWRMERKREGSLFDWWQAPRAATQPCLEDKSKLIQKLSSLLRAADGKKKLQKSETSFPRARFLKWKCVCVCVCVVKGFFTEFCTFMQMSLPSKISHFSSHQINWL